MVRGDGAYVWDAHGNRFLDGIGGLWFANVGYGRRELIDAAARQLGTLPQYSYFANLANPPATELAAKLAELAPGDLNHIFYSTGGSTANDSAVRIAHYYFDTIGKPGKRLVISRRNAYHGSTFLASALSGKAGDKSGFQFPAGLVHHVSEANCYRMPDGVADQTAYCDYLVADLERTIAELGAANIACFFAEPIMGAGGVLVAPEGYHLRMKRVCEEHDILYVSDEVVTAFGRLGHFFASRDRYGIVPDMIVTAKRHHVRLPAAGRDDHLGPRVRRTVPRQSRRRRLRARLHVFRTCGVLRRCLGQYRCHRSRTHMPKGFGKRVPISSID